MTLKNICLTILIFSNSLILKAESTVDVLHVINGELLKVEINGQKMTVQLAGIDIPSYKKNRNTSLMAKNTSNTPKEIIQIGQAAREYILLHTFKKNCIFEFENQKDENGNPYVYIYQEDGKLLNEELLKNGFGTLSLPAGLKHKTRLAKAYWTAKKSYAGLWLE